MAKPEEESVTKEIKHSFSAPVKRIQVQLMTNVIPGSKSVSGTSQDG